MVSQLRRNPHDAGYARIPVYDAREFGTAQSGKGNATMTAFDAVVFDMDGTLVHTETLHRQSWELAIADRGLALPSVDYEKTFAGRPGREICRDVFGFEGEEIELFVELVERKYRGLADGNLSPLPGVLAFIELVESLPIAVAMSARRDSARKTLEALGLWGRFEAVVTADDITQGKPHPEIFLLAADRLGVDPNRCLAFEDSHSGLKAARAAGMTCIGVSTSHDVLPDAHLVIDGFHDPRLPLLVRGEWTIPAAR